MGAWGVHFDENDGALDFLGDIEETKDWSAIASRLTDYVADGGYDDADEAIAAAELVAAALGKASARLQPELLEWASANSEAASASLGTARKAVLLAANESELAELWAEADEYAEWQASVKDLNDRLASANV